MPKGQQVLIAVRYLPKSGSKQNLRPVHFWIYGGGFTSGASNSADGGTVHKIFSPTLTPS